MGKIGCKVWIFKKEHYKKTEREMLDEAAKLLEKEKIEDLAKAAEETPSVLEPILPMKDVPEDIPEIQEQE